MRAQEVLANLSPSVREAAHLAFHVGLDIPEIAQTLNLVPKKVRELVRTARVEFRDRIHDDPELMKFFGRRAMAQSAEE